MYSFIHNWRAGGPILEFVRDSLPSTFPRLSDETLWKYSIKLWKPSFMCSSIQIGFIINIVKKNESPGISYFRQDQDLKKNFFFFPFSHNKKEYGLFLIFILFLPPCKTVNFCLKIPLMRGDLAQTSLINLVFSSNEAPLRILCQRPFSTTFIIIYIQLKLFLAREIGKKWNISPGKFCNRLLTEILTQVPIIVTL